MKTYEWKDPITVPLELFRDLVWLQRVYATLLNAWDGGERKPLNLPEQLRIHVADIGPDGAKTTGGGPCR